MMTPVGRLVLLRAFPRSQLVTAMTYMTVPAVIGPALGPILGGLLTTYASWRWVFYVNVPIGTVGVLLALAALSACSGTALALPGTVPAMRRVRANKSVSAQAWPYRYAFVARTRRAASCARQSHGVRPSICRRSPVRLSVRTISVSVTDRGIAV